MSVDTVDIMECLDNFKDQPGILSLIKCLQSDFGSLKSKLIETEKRLAYLESYVSQMDKIHSRTWSIFVMKWKIQKTVC